MGDTFPSNMGEFNFDSSSDECQPFLAHLDAFWTGSSIRYIYISTELKSFTP